MKVCIKQHLLQFNTPILTVSNACTNASNVMTRYNINVTQHLEEKM